MSNESARVWYYENKEAVLRNRKEKRKLDPEKSRAACRASYAKKRDYYAKKHRLWFQKNKEKFRLYLKTWRSENPGKQAEYSRRRRRLKDGSFVDDVSLEVLIVRDNGMCGICDDHVTFGQESTDHIFPLSRGGKHSYLNTQLAHIDCNRRKNAKVILNGPV